MFPWNSVSTLPLHQLRNVSYPQWRQVLPIVGRIHFVIGAKVVHLFEFDSEICDISGEIWDACSPAIESNHTTKPPSTVDQQQGNLSIPAASCSSSAPDNFSYFVHSTLEALSLVEQNMGSWQELVKKVELRKGLIQFSLAKARCYAKILITLVEAKP